MNAFDKSASSRILERAVAKAATLTRNGADRADVVRTLEVGGYGAALLMDEAAS